MSGKLRYSILLSCVWAARSDRIPPTAAHVRRTRAESCRGRTENISAMIAPIQTHEMAHRTTEEEPPWQSAST